MAQSEEEELLLSPSEDHDYPNHLPHLQQQQRRLLQQNLFNCVRDEGSGDGVLIGPASGQPIRIPQDLPPLFSNAFPLTESESEASTQTSSTVRSLYDLRRRSFEVRRFSPLLIRTYSDDSMNSGQMLAPKFKAHAPKNSKSISLSLSLLSSRTLASARRSIGYIFRALNDSSSASHFD